MEVEEHPITRTSRAVSGIGHLRRNWGALNDLDMVLRGCAESGARRCSSIHFRSLGSWWIIVGLESILIVLMLLLSGRMASIRRLSHYTPLLNLVLVWPRWESVGCLLLGLHLCISGLVSSVRVGSCCRSVDVNLVLNPSTKVLLSLIHHMMMLDLIGGHWWSYLHCLSLIHGGVGGVGTTTLDIHWRPTSNRLMMVNPLDPGITVEFTCRGPQLWVQL